jgi:solute carrier family 25 protein 34/35
MVGSAVQLASYDHCKTLLLHSVEGCKDGVMLHFMSGMLSGIFVVLAVTPFDVSSTRLMNQKVAANGRAELYTGVADCMIQTFRAEGIAGLYKGVSALYLRLGPHTVFTFLLLEQFNRLLF